MITDIDHTIPNLVSIVNRELITEFGQADCCVLACATLVDVLSQLQIPARPLRIEASVSAPEGHPREHYGCVLGGDGDGTRRPAAGPKMWRGHLAVVADEHFLLDATLDQVNKSSPWLAAKPFFHAVSPAFLDGKELSWFGLQDSQWHPLASWQTPWPGPRVRYTAFPGRGGYKSAPDWKRPSHRRILVERVLSAINH
jgi:hypothetical protein